MNTLNLQTAWLGLPTNSRKALAERIGARFEYLSVVCNGHRKPGRVLKFALAKEFGVDPELLDLTVTPQKPREVEGIDEPTI